MPNLTLYSDPQQLHRAMATGLAGRPATSNNAALGDEQRERVSGRTWAAKNHQVWRPIKNDQRDEVRNESSQLASKQLSAISRRRKSRQPDEMMLGVLITEAEGNLSGNNARELRARYPCWKSGASAAGGLSCIARQLRSSATDRTVTVSSLPWRVATGVGL